MLQSFINKSFYYLFVFSLLFVIVFYNLIGFQYTDEICAMVLFALLVYSLLQTPEWNFDRVFLLTILIFAFYTLYSIYIGSNVKAAIIKDLGIQMKPYLGFFCAYQLRPFFDANRKKILKEIIFLCWLLFLFPLGVAGAINERILYYFMDHPAYYGIAITIVSICYLFSGSFTKRERFVFMVMLSIGLVSGRSKFYGFYMMSLFCVLFADNFINFKLNLKNVLLLGCMLGAVVLVAWEKIYFYFVSALTGSSELDPDMIARFVLYYTSGDILMDYFPFGSGLASFATYTSGEYYSDIYLQYGIDNVWGLSKSYTSFISDTYYPVLAQFGMVGVGLFVLFWGYIVKNAIVLYKQHPAKKPQMMIVIILIVGFLAIENTTTSTFVAQGGFFVMMMMGLILSNMKYDVKQGLKQNAL